MLREVTAVAKKKITKKTVTVKPRSGKTAAVVPEKKELVALLDQLSRDEISWLITQSKTMIYNQKVDEVNSAAKDLQDSRKKTAVPKKTQKSSPGNEAVDIVQAGGPRNFNILMGNARLFINLNELKALVKISEAAHDGGDGAGRLYRWFHKERNDILIDGSITGPADPRLYLIFKIIRERYTVG